MQTKNILVTGCAENLENTLCLLPDPFFRKQGITGLWQVTDRNKDTFYSRISKDIEYVKNKNFIEDMMIIIKTMKVMLVREEI